MKNEDIKKHFLDVKNAFVPEKLIKRTLPFLLLFSVCVFGQIPINNFGHSNIIQTYSGYTKFTLLDFNNDGTDDIFLFGNNRKNFVIHQGIKDSTFAEAERHFFFFPIDDIKFFAKSKTGEDYYIFVSRNKRLVGLVSFTKKNTLQLLHKIELDSYPSSIKIVDLNNDEKPEALIYGNNFSGLAIVENNGFRLHLNKIINDKIFTDALVCDLNQDDYKEIVLTDLLNNSINFYESTTNSELQSMREITFDETISKIKILNYNDDNFFDIAVVNESGMEILLGDSVYSFSETVKLNFSSTIDDFEFYDFNLDGNEDILLLNKIDDEIIFYFDRTSYENNLVYSLSGITEYKFEKNKNKIKLITLSKKGKLNVFTNTNQWGNLFDFHVSGKPTIIKSVRNEKTGNVNFAIYDEQNKIVNIVLTDSVGNFSEIVKIAFTNSISDFIISPSLSFVIGYSQGEKLLEKISLTNFGKKIIKHFVYAEYPISSVQVDSSANIVAIELDDDKLYSQKFIKTGNSYITEQPMFIDSSVVSSTFGEGKFNPIYWKQFENKNLLISQVKSKKETVIRCNNSKTFAPLFIENQSGNSQQIITYVKNDLGEFLYFPGLELHKKLEINKNLISSTSNAKDFFFLKDVKGNTDKVFYNNKKENQIIELTYNFKKNRFEQTKIIETNKINNFIVEKIFGKMYLIYSDEDTGNISFKVY